ncbi:hypothetical protein H4R24_001509 [Coemansia sp. RSA 988]|nr:hypothetical protein H4R24_001509 [Coemansia sp. RSA 988]
MSLREGILSMADEAIRVADMAVVDTAAIAAAAAVVAMAAAAEAEAAGEMVEAEAAAKELLNNRIFLQECYFK